MADIHNCKRRFEKACESLDSLNLCAADKIIVQNYIEFCLCNNVTYGKIDVYLRNLKVFIQTLNKPIADATKEDIVRVMMEINENQWKSSTRNVFKIVVRRLYQLVYNMEWSPDYPDIVRWVRLDHKKHNQHLPDELLTKEEIDRLIDGCKSLRDKAFIAVLAESGARIGEIAAMKVKHVSFETYGARLTLYGKTGSRRILIAKSSQILKEWLGVHPYNYFKESYLWPAQDGRLICYNALTKVLRTAAKNAGVNKRIYPHLFRYTRATQLANVMSDQVLKQYLGWDKNSTMHEIYIHMSGKESDEAVLRESGIIYTTVPTPRQTTLTVISQNRPQNIFQNRIIQKLNVEN